MACGCLRLWLAFGLWLFRRAELWVPFGQLMACGLEVKHGVHRGHGGNLNFFITHPSNILSASAANGLESERSERSFSERSERSNQRAQRAV